MRPLLGDAHLDAVTALSALLSRMDVAIAPVHDTVCADTAAAGVGTTHTILERLSPPPATIDASRRTGRAA